MRHSRPLALAGLLLVESALAGLLLATPAAGTAPSSPAPTDTALVEQGQRLYAQACSSCHGAGGEGTRLSGGVEAPSLIGVGAASVDFNLSTGRMPLANPSAQALRKPPAFDARQRDAIVAYVSSLAPGGPAIPHVDLEAGSVTRGASLYLDNCAACHNAAAVGGALSYGSFAPSLHQADPVQVAEAVRTGPGNMPVFGPETFTGGQLDDLVRYVVYLQHPSDPGGAGLGHFGPIPEGFVGLFFGVGTLLLFVAWVGTRA